MMLSCLFAFGMLCTAPSSTMNRKVPGGNLFWFVFSYFEWSGYCMNINSGFGRIKIIQGSGYIHSYYGSMAESVFPGYGSAFSSMYSQEYILLCKDGVPTGLGRRTGLFGAVGDGDVNDLKLTGGLTISILGLVYCLLSWSFVVDLFTPATFGAAAGVAGCVSLSDGPVSR